MCAVRGEAGGHRPGLAAARSAGPPPPPARPAPPLPCPCQPPPALPVELLQLDAQRKVLGQGPLREQARLAGGWAGVGGSTGWGTGRHMPAVPIPALLQGRAALLALQPAIGPVFSRSRSRCRGHCPRPGPRPPPPAPAARLHKGAGADQEVGAGAGDEAQGVVPRLRVVPEVDVGVLRAVWKGSWRGVEGVGEGCEVGRGRKGGGEGWRGVRRRARPAHARRASAGAAGGGLSR